MSRLWQESNFEVSRWVKDSRSIGQGRHKWTDLRQTKTQTNHLQWTICCHRYDSLAEHDSDRDESFVLIKLQEAGWAQNSSYKIMSYTTLSWHSQVHGSIGDIHDHDARWHAWQRDSEWNSKRRPLTCSVNAATHTGELVENLETQVAN